MEWPGSVWRVPAMEPLLLLLLLLEPSLLLLISPLLLLISPLLLLISPLLHDFGGVGLEVLRQAKYETVPTGYLHGLE